MKQTTEVVEEFLNEEISRRLEREEQLVRELADNRRELDVLFELDNKHSEIQVTDQTTPLKFCSGCKKEKSQTEFEGYETCKYCRQRLQELDKEKKVHQKMREDGLYKSKSRKQLDYRAFAKTEIFRKIVQRLLESGRYTKTFEIFSEIHDYYKVTTRRERTQLNRAFHCALEMNDTLYTIEYKGKGYGTEIKLTKIPLEVDLQDRPLEQPHSNGRDEHNTDGVPTF